MHGEIQKVVVTSVVMKLFLCQVRQALAGDFIDPVAISRLKTCGWVSGEGLRAGPSLFNGRPRSRRLSEISDRHEDVLV